MDDKVAAETTESKKSKIETDDTLNLRKMKSIKHSKLTISQSQSQWQIEQILLMTTEQKEVVSKGPVSHIRCCAPESRQSRGILLNDGFSTHNI